MNMTLLPIALVAVLFGVIILLAMTVYRIRRLSKEGSEILTTYAELGSEPDTPIPFGYKCSWYTVRASEAEILADAFGLKKTTGVNWEKGIEAAYQGFVFISPPVDGWTFVVGTHHAQARLEKITQKATSMLLELSSEFGEAQFYVTHRVVELHVWAKALNGKLIRAYGYLGEADEIFWDEGKAEIPEVDIRSDINEETVMEIARTWSISPTDLGKYESEPTLGLIGRI
jgi:hypothetical protein